MGACDEAFGLSLGETAPSADLGSSSRLQARKATCGFQSHHTRRDIPTKLATLPTLLELSEKILSMSFRQ